MKRVLSCILALCLAFCLAVPAVAAEPSVEADEYAALSLAGADWSYDEANGAWTLSNVSYCLNPVAPELEAMNIYVPAAYLDADGNQTKTVVNGYNAETAPILYINTVGGYSQSSPSGIAKYTAYLEAGYVVVSPGSRGKETEAEDGTYTGKAPAGLVDLKAGVRFLKYNDDNMPGSAERIVSIGTSAGGNMSALLACTGNVSAYDPYLEEIGAVMTATDDIYAAQCYCPISDLENADMAYEWFYNSDAQYAFMTSSGELNDFQQALSDDLAAQFPAYVNSLGLTDSEGNALTLTGLREGSYYDYLLEVLSDSLSAYIGETFSVTVSGMSAYTYIDEEAAQAYVDELNAGGEWVTIDYTYAKVSTGPSTIVTYADSAVCTISSIEDFVANFRSRGKQCPSFDNLERGEAENQEFGTETMNYRHFDANLAEMLASGKYNALEGFDEAYVEAYAEAQEAAQQVYLMNPLNFIEEADVAPFVRIRTGSSDEHTSFTVSMNLALAIDTYTDSAVDYALAWGQGHGEAEINSDDLTAWIERVCKFEAPKTDDQIADLLNLSNMEYTWTLSGEGDSAYYVLSPIVEVANPELADYQGLSVAIPAYYVKSVNEDGSLTFDYDYEFTNPNGVTYTAATAPIIINTGAAGYSAGTTSTAGGSYVAYGYINVACGNRGKSLSAINASGEKYYCGDAPYCLVDQKACVRWVKYNIALGNLCGDADRMVSTGGSGGGAHSLMLAATGNHPDFYPYLEESGAVMRYTDENGQVVEISDAIWGCCPYSAITNLQEANIAYEFESGLATDDAVVSSLSPFRQILSNAEAQQYMEYINGRGLTYDIDGDGVREELTIEYDEATDTWSGTYVELMEQVAEEQLEWYLNNIPEDEQDWVYAYDGESNAEAYLKGDYEGSGEMASAETTEGYASVADDSAPTGNGEDLTAWVTYTVDENGQYDVDFDIGDFMVYRGRSKSNPSFDDLDLGQAENQEFGDADQDFKHWDIFVLNAMNEVYDQLEAAYDGDAEAESFEALYNAYVDDIAQMQAGDKFGNNIVYLYNPLNYILDEQTELPAWVHIVHGTADTDSSVLISMNDGVAFDMMGVNTFFAWSWDDHHVAGDPVGTTMQGYIDAMVLAGE
jgi:hypothetical protein